MLIDTRHARLQLGRGDHLKLSSARNARLTPVSGVAWITVDRDSSDTVIPPGDSFVVPSDRTVLIGPLFASLTLDVDGTCGAVPRAAKCRSRLVAKLRSLAGTVRKLARSRIAA